MEIWTGILTLSILWNLYVICISYTCYFCIILFYVSFLISCDFFLFLFFLIIKIHYNSHRVEFWVGFDKVSFTRYFRVNTHEHLHIESYWEAISTWTWENRVYLMDFLCFVLFDNKIRVLTVAGVSQRKDLLFKALQNDWVLFLIDHSVLLPWIHFAILKIWFFFSKQSVGVS